MEVYIYLNNFSEDAFSENSQTEEENKTIRPVNEETSMLHQTRLKRWQRAEETKPLETLSSIQKLFILQYNNIDKIEVFRVFYDVALLVTRKWFECGTRHWQ